MWSSKLLQRLRTKVMITLGSVTVDIWKIELTLETVFVKKERCYIIGSCCVIGLIEFVMRMAGCTSMRVHFEYCNSLLMGIGKTLHKKLEDANYYGLRTIMNDKLLMNQFLGW